MTTRDILFRSLPLANAGHTKQAFGLLRAAKGLWGASKAIGRVVPEAASAVGESWNAARGTARAVAPELKAVANEARQVQRAPYAKLPFNSPPAPMPYRAPTPVSYAAPRAPYAKLPGAAPVSPSYAPPRPAGVIPRPPAGPQPSPSFAPRPPARTVTPYKPPVGPYDDLASGTKVRSNIYSSEGDITIQGPRYMETQGGQAGQWHYPSQIGGRQLNIPASQIHGIVSAP